MCWVIKLGEEDSRDLPTRYDTKSKDMARARAYHSISWRMATHRTSDLVFYYYYFSFSFCHFHLFFESRHVGSSKPHARQVNVLTFSLPIEPHGKKPQQSLSTSFFFFYFRIFIFILLIYLFFSQEDFLYFYWLFFSPIKSEDPICFFFRPFSLALALYPGHLNLWWRIQWLDLDLDLDFAFWDFCHRTIEFRPLGA